jgi:hypothetical protein
VATLSSLTPDDGFVGGVDAPEPLFNPPAALAKLKLGRTVDALRSRPPNVLLPDPPAGEAVALVVFALLLLLLLLLLDDEPAAFEISRLHPPPPSSPPLPPRLGLIVTLGTLLCRLAGGTPEGLVRILGVAGAGDPGPL